MGVEACLVILAALSSSGAEEGYLTRESVVARAAAQLCRPVQGPGSKTKTGRMSGRWLSGDAEDRRDGREGQVSRGIDSQGTGSWEKIGGPA